MLSSFLSAKIAAAAFAGGLTMTGGLATAGALPGPAQNVASNVLDKIGVSVPGPHGPADHPVNRGASADHKPADVAADHESDDTKSDDAATPADTKGAEISKLARTTESTGRDKGAEISNKASGGKSRAGQSHGAPGSNPAGGETPNPGGLDTGGTTSGGADSTGADQANPTASGGSADAGQHPTGDHHPTGANHPGGRP